MQEESVYEENWKSFISNLKKLKLQKYHSQTDSVDTIGKVWIL